MSASFERLVDWVELRWRARRLYRFWHFEELRRRHKEMADLRKRVASEAGYDNWPACEVAQRHAEWMRANGARHARGPLDPPEPVPRPLPPSEPLLSAADLHAAWARGEQSISLSVAARPACGCQHQAYMSVSGVLVQPGAGWEHDRDRADGVRRCSLHRW